MKPFLRLVWVTADPFVGPKYTVGALLFDGERTSFVECPRLPNEDAVGDDTSRFMEIVQKRLRSETDAVNPKRISLAVEFQEPMEINGSHTPDELRTFVRGMWKQ